MARFESKADFLEVIAVERGKLEAMLERLTEAELIEPGACGEWSVKDILAHLYAWEQMVMSWYEAGLRGEVPRTPADDLNWRQTPILNQRIYETYHDAPLDDIIAAFNNSYAEILNIIRHIPEADLLEPGLYAWTGKLALVNYFTSATSSHYRWAHTEIRRWLKRKAIPSN
ncbi:MAG: ClbS/DfsB family four-helix bundle protein [Chloroflexota bacterium]